jgi:hypothetical protein
MWKEWVFAYQAYVQYVKCQRRQCMCRHKLATFISSSVKTCFVKVNKKYESFCQGVS